MKLLLIVVLLSGCVVETSEVADESIVLPPPEPPVPIPFPQPCSGVTFAPASARPGDVIDVTLLGRTGVYHATAVTFAPAAAGVPLTILDGFHMRATVPMAAVTGHVKITCHWITGADSYAESTADFTPLAITATASPATATIDYNATTTVSVAFGRAAPQQFMLNVAPSSSAVAINGLAPGTPVSLTIPAGALSASFTVRGAAGGAATLTMTSQNLATTTSAITVRAPALAISAPADAEVHWGQSAVYTTTITGTGGLSGNVTLEAQNLPAGASASPVTVAVPLNGTVTASVTVDTVEGGTELETHGIRIAATHAVASRQTRNVDLHVLPSEGMFTPLAWFTTDHVCDATISADVTAAGTVRFLGPGFASNGIPFLFYAFTPGCRAAVVFGSGPSVQLYNLKFARAVSGTTPGTQVTNFGGTFDHTRFLASPDGSYVIPVAALANGNLSALLYRMLDGAAQPNRVYTGTLAAAIVGDEVRGTPSMSMAFDWQLP